METNWTKEEFEAYLLCYCANADCVESPEETALILNKVSQLAYEKMATEFKADNDYQSISKIIDTAQRFDLSKSDIDTLFNEIKQMFHADGKVDIMEREIYIGLKRVLK